MENEHKTIVDKRNYGIDALRLYAMFLVVVLHVLLQGGILNSAQNGQYVISWLLEIAAYCAVNCFAIVSGYVSYTEDEKIYHYSKYVVMWLQVIYYSFGITLIGFVLKPNIIGIKQVIKSLLPVVTNHYWYFSAYTGVFFLVPWLNKFVRRCSEAELNKLVFVLFAVYSCYGTVVGYFADSFRVNGGYSCIWLMFLYLCGAWMKKCHVEDKINEKQAILMIIGCIMLTWCVKLFAPFGKDILVSYISPTIVLPAVCYVALFSKLKIFRGGVQKKIIQSFAPASFGVYLIHTQSLIWKYFMKDRFAWISDSPVWLVPIQVFGCASMVFITCLLIEKIRIMIFDVFNMKEKIAWIMRIPVSSGHLFRN